MSENSNKTVFRRVVVTEEAKKKFLVGNSAPYLGKPIELPVGTDFTIGREEARSLQLPSDMVSRHHATIAIKDGSAVLVDEDSSNGTFLNGNQIEPKQIYTLNHRDVVKFDTFEFIYVDTAAGDLWQTLKPLSREGSQIVSFYSPKGGSGISTIVVNLAHMLAKLGGKKVVIVDFDLRFGDVLTFANGKPGLSIIELIKEPEITPENILGFLHHGNVFDYLPGPKKTELAELVNANHVKQILWSLQAKYDFVLVDLKSDIDDITINTWELSSLIYLVAQPEIGHLLASRKIIDIMNSFKYPESKFKVIINKLGRPGTFSEEEAKGVLKRELITVPYAPDDAVITSNGGHLLYDEKGHAPLTEALVNLEHSILGEEMQVKTDGGIFSKLKSILGI